VVLWFVFVFSCGFWSGVVFFFGYVCSFSSGYGLGGGGVCVRGFFSAVSGVGLCFQVVCGGVVLWFSFFGYVFFRFFHWVRVGG